MNNPGKTLITSLLFSFLILACNGSGGESDINNGSVDGALAIHLKDIVLPPGFKISVFADGLKNARSMAMGSSGTIYIGTQNEGKVYAIKDSDGDNVADQKYEIAKGLRAPNGVAFRDGALYVAEVGRLLKYEDIENNLQKPGEPKVIYDDYPKDFHHGWKYIAFGPDGKLYVPVGAPCNLCESSNEIYASITRMNADGSGREIYAKGVRNSVGFTWHPETGEMWFTDNGRDMLGNDVPPCELNRISAPGQHFGYPYFHGGTIKDPEFGDKFPCSDFVAPAQQLGPHVAPLGIKFYTGNMFPEEYKGHAFIAEHGSWNRDKKIGYRISLVKVENNLAVSYETFASGWLDDETQNVWGRPVDVLILEDGSMLVSDDMVGAIYRISYSG
ncbi:MAG: sorbosone dehydrogenase family protein [Bacteroidetes bacterium]|nr:sorbosone dehydrogenase family protein [Bacteroidota bacterium]MDA1120118.1 sorbosone dehydrogenase family protein [Bacteroidota bacterium]